jgi:hypothetical protein
MTWTKLAYGTLIATAMLGGSVALFHDSPRSTVKAIDIATLDEALLEHRAALNTTGNHSTNTSTLSGWGTQTNVAEGRMWNFNPHIDLWYEARIIPLYAAVTQRKAMTQILAGIVAIIPSYLDYVTTNYQGYLAPVYLTQTGLWARLGIGNGTNLWTVGVDTNGLPVYSNTVGSVLSTQTLWEAWRVLGACTSTYRTGSASINSSDLLGRADSIGADGPVSIYQSGLQSKVHNDTPYPPYYAPGTNSTGPNGVVANSFTFSTNVYNSAFRNRGSASGYQSGESYQATPPHVFYARSYDPSFWTNNVIYFADWFVLADALSWYQYPGGDSTYSDWPYEAPFWFPVSANVSFSNGISAADPFLRYDTNYPARIYTSYLERFPRQYPLSVATFPSGVTARVEFYYAVSVDWNARSEAVDMSFVSNFVSRQEWGELVFSGEISTNRYTNLVASVCPRLIDYVPESVRTLDCVWYKAETKLVSNFSAGSVAWRSTNFILAGSARLIGVPSAVIHWQFKYR